jgi:hypothetical protein
MNFNDQVDQLKQDLRELAGKGSGRRRSTAEVWKHYSLSEEDVLFSD